MNDQHPALRREDQPNGSVRVYFSAPILFHADPKGFVTFRQPTVSEVLDHGDPRSFVYDAEGFGVPHVDRPALVKWITRLAEDHDIDMIGRERDLSLGMLIEDVVLDFFQSARKRLRPASGRLPTPG